MKVIHLNRSDSEGGAARAAYRIHQSLQNTGVSSEFWVNQRLMVGGDAKGLQSSAERLADSSRNVLARRITNFLRTENKVLHSPAFFPSGLVAKINASDADIVHLHWVQNEMLSVRAISRIRKPILWTLHDMWAFCGAEHYTNDYRWKEGYNKNNRPDYEAGVDINRWTWNRKKKHWGRPVSIVTPSRWLERCVNESGLMGGWPTKVIPNPLDTAKWEPIDRRLARRILGLPDSVPLVLFAALGGVSDERKGFDLLRGALKSPGLDVRDLNLVVLGERPTNGHLDLTFPLHFLGHLHDDVTLRLAYSAVDLLIVPSRLEAFGQVASEAHSCGTPVVAFDLGGLRDVVRHRETGYLAKAFDVHELAAGIAWVLSQPPNIRAKLGTQARKLAVETFDAQQIGRNYARAYLDVLDSFNVAL